MIDYARPPYEQAMYELHLPPTPPAPTRLEDFQVFNKKGAAYVYGNYYGNPYYDPSVEPELEAGAATTVYHNLLSSREAPPRDNWRTKILSHWNEEDTVSWIIDTTQCMGFTEYEIPYYNFRILGTELIELKREQLTQRLLHPNVDPNLTRRIADNVFDKLQNLMLQQESYRQPTVLRYAEGDTYSQDQILDLDSQEHKNRLYASDYKPNDNSLLAGACDSSDDAEYDILRTSESPEFYGSDGSKSGDEDDKRKFKRPPGRPKGSGKKITKRPRSVSVPEFLRNLLLDPKYCPSIIKWEDHDIGKFRFVKPDEVAKLWGRLKQNDNMTFEKFSRAMRYHYRQAVLVSVPTARLVYQFGHKGPDFRTPDPNFHNASASASANVKTEIDHHYDIYS